MFVVHGVRIQRDRMGVVAELCPRCRDIRPATVSKVLKYHHVYFVPVSSKKLMHYEVKCQACKLAIPIADVNYAGYLPSDPGDVGLLVESTNPDVVDRLEERISLDERIARGEASRADRIRFITELLTDAGYRTQAKLADSGTSVIEFVVSRPSTILLLAITLTLLLTAPMFLFQPRPDIVMFGAICGAALVPLIFTIRSFATGKKRWLRKAILPYLAGELARVSPTDEELIAALHPLVQRRFRIAILLRGDAKLRSLLASNQHASIDIADVPA